MGFALTKPCLLDCENIHKRQRRPQVDLRDRRELNNGFGNALTRAFELVVTPMIVGFLGFLLGGKLGTRPLFMLMLFGSAFGYVVWKQHGLYSTAMDSAQRKVTGPRNKEGK